MQEKWKPVIGYEGHYEVSSLGRVRSLDRVNDYGRSLKGRLRSFWMTKKGYCRIALCIDGKNKKHLIHRLVAEAFLSRVEGKNQINHINGVKSDNRPENLEWCNNYENWIHSARLGKQDRSHKSGGVRDMSKYI